MAGGCRQREREGDSPKLSPSSGPRPRALPPLAPACERIADGRGSNAMFHTMPPPEGSNANSVSLRIRNMSSIRSDDVPNVPVANSQFLEHDAD